MPMRLFGVLLFGMFLLALATPAGAATSTVDLQAEETATVMGPDGYPIVAYTNISGELRVADCADSACTPSNTFLTTVDDSHRRVVDMALSVDGNPIIVYLTPSGGGLRLVVCGNTRCSPDLATYRTASSWRTEWAAVVLKDDGSPFIAALGQVNDPSTMYAVDCADATCSSSTKTVVRVGNSPLGIDVAIGEDGYPVISHHDGGLLLIRCGDSPCSSGNATTTVVDALTTPRRETSVAIADDGFPIIVYQTTSAPDAWVRVVDCADSDCTSTTITNLDTVNLNASAEGYDASLTLDEAGLPVIAYYRATPGTQDSSFRLAECANTDCSITNITTISPVGDGRFASVAVSGTGFPVMSYQGVAGNLRVTDTGPLTGPDGSISGRIVDESGNPTPQGRAEVYTDDEFFGTYDADGSGFYETGGLSTDTYYVFLYNGDDETFIDWFPEWYLNKPSLLWQQANPIVITPLGGPIVGVDAQLEPLYIDMWDSVFVDSIIWMQNTGITKGCAVDRYCPDDPVTRGQMAAFLARALGLTDSGGGDLFTDDDNSIFEGAIDKLATAGVTKGCNPPANTKFCPDDHVTRGQMAAFLVRALGYTDNGGGNLFTDDDGHVFEGAIDKFAAAGVTKGCNPPANTQFCPDELVTRGQMAAFLRRALEDSFTASVQSTVGGPQQAIRRQPSKHSTKSASKPRP